MDSVGNCGFCSSGPKDLFGGLCDDCQVMRMQRINAVNKERERSPKREDTTPDYRNHDDLKLSKPPAFNAFNQNSSSFGGPSRIEPSAGGYVKDDSNLDKQEDVKSATKVHKNSLKGIRRGNTPTLGPHNVQDAHIAYGPDVNTSRRQSSSHGRANTPNFGGHPRGPGPTHGLNPYNIDFHPGALPQFGNVYTQQDAGRASDGNISLGRRKRGADRDTELELEVFGAEIPQDPRGRRHKSRKAQRQQSMALNQRNPPEPNAIVVKPERVDDVQQHAVGPTRYQYCLRHNNPHHNEFTVGRCQILAANGVYRFPTSPFDLDSRQVDAMFAITVPILNVREAYVFLHKAYAWLAPQKAYVEKRDALLRYVAESVSASVLVVEANVWVQFMKSACNATALLFEELFKALLQYLRRSPQQMVKKRLDQSAVARNEPPLEFPTKEEASFELAGLFTYFPAEDDIGSLHPAELTTLADSITKSVRAYLRIRGGIMEAMLQFLGLNGGVGQDLNKKRRFLLIHKITPTVKQPTTRLDLLQDLITGMLIKIPSGEEMDAAFQKIVIPPAAMSPAAAQPASQHAFSTQPGPPASLALEFGHGGGGGRRGSPQPDRGRGGGRYYSCKR